MSRILSESMTHAGLPLRVAGASTKPQLGWGLFHFSVCQRDSPERFRHVGKHSRPEGHGSWCSTSSCRETPMPLKCLDRHFRVDRRFIPANLMRWGWRLTSEGSILFSSENTLLCRICAQVFVGGEVAVAE